MRADAFSCVILVFLDCDCTGHDLAGLVSVASLLWFFVPCCLVEQGRGAKGFDWLLNGLDLLLFLLALH